MPDPIVCAASVGVFWPISDVPEGDARSGEQQQQGDVLVIQHYGDRYGQLEHKFLVPVVCCRWHCTNSSDCQVRVGGAPWNCYGVNIMKAVIGAYM